MVPEKLRALYVTGVTQAILRAQIWFSDKIVLCHALRRDFKRRATSSAFSLLLNAEMRK
jgi:hypothetical protein